VVSVWWRLAAFVIACVALTVVALGAASLQHAQLRAEFERITRGADGRIGACARDAAGITCVNAQQRFSLQSVMKLLVGVAVLDAVDRGTWPLDEQVVVKREDLSLFVQPIAKLVTADGFRTTIADLVRRAIVDSDSAATDFLVAKLGGPAAVQAVLDRRGVRGVRFDRDERQLQTETYGLTWRPEYVDAKVLDQAIAAVPELRREAAWRAYLNDTRDTATPEGMANLLYLLAEGRLLTPASTAWLMKTMEETTTFPDRLKAGLLPGWRLGHKTGTSDSWRGRTGAVNDVGLLTAPDGTRVAIAVFISNTGASGPERAAVMASLARATIGSYR
jgi:beta-lactamase class A